MITCFLTNWGTVIVLGEEFQPVCNFYDTSSTPKARVIALDSNWQKEIEIIAETRAYDGFLKIEEGVVKESDGTEEGITYSRFAVNRPNAVANAVRGHDFFSIGIA